jgi:hypothetical protein
MINKKLVFCCGVMVCGMLAISSCHPYAGTRNMKETVVMGYGKGTIEKRVIKQTDDKFGIKRFSAQIGVIIIGYAFQQASREVEKRRDGDFKVENAPIRADGSFPSDGFVIVLRTVHDKNNKYPDVANVADFLENRPGSLAAELVNQICAPRSTSTFRITEAQLIDAVKKSFGVEKYDSQHKIAYLAICPLFPIRNQPAGSEPLYAIGFDGAYYPLFKGQRFVFERQSLVRKYTDSKEVMSIELYGPNGSGFSTGVIPIPVLWTPPNTGKMWVTAEQWIKDLPEEQQKQMESLLDLSYAKSTNRGTFVKARPEIIPLIKGDAFVDESSDGTKLIQDGLDAIKGEAESLVE